MITRRNLLRNGAAGLAATTVLPYAALAQEGGSQSFETAGGEVTVHPVSHASFVMETPVGVIYNDPVGGAEAYADFPAPDLILITHEHGDHFEAETLQALVGEETQLLTNPAVYEMLPEELQSKAEQIGNGESTEKLGLTIEAVPAHNTTESRMQYHPVGRDNGYVLNFDGLRVYIAGDTEPTEEMEALENIDVAFLPMNLPYTMTVDQAAAAVAAFQPTYVYPYHYRGSDPQAFAALVEESGAGTEVLMGPWYEEGETDA